MEKMLKAIENDITTLDLILTRSVPVRCYGHKRFFRKYIKHGKHYFLIHKYQFYYVYIL
jgi:hypothetical protein